MNYFHIKDKILEIKVSSIESSIDIIKNINAAFLSSFHLVENCNNCDQITSYNGGFSINYPDILEAPIPENRGDFSISLNYKNDENSHIWIDTVPGQGQDVLNYWFNDYAPGEEIKNFVPRDIKLRDKDCIYVQYTNDNYLSDTYYCGNNGINYKISYGRESEDLESDLTFYQTLGSFEFINNTTGDNYIYKSVNANFQLLYPKNFEVYEEKYENETYLRFNEYKNYDDYYGWDEPSASLDLTITKYQGDLDNYLSSDTNYYSYIDADKYSDVSFRGKTVKFATDAEDWGNGSLVNNAYRIMKNGDYVISIRESQPDGNPDPRIDQILDSFQFTE